MITLYSVVEFDKDNEVAVVPCHWVNRRKNECSWPPRNCDVTSLVKSCAAKKTNWTSHKVEILGEFESYARAHQKMLRVEKGKAIESSCAEDDRRGKAKPVEKPVRLQFPSSAPKSAVNAPKSPSRPSTSHSSLAQLKTKTQGSVSRELVKKKLSESKTPVPKRTRVDESSGKEAAAGSFSYSPLASVPTPASSMTNRFQFTSQTPRDMSHDIQDLLRGQARQKVQLQQLQAQLDKMHAFIVQNRRTLDDDEEEENVVELPIKNLAELRKFDVRLEKEKKLRKYLRGEIASIGSSHAREGVRLGLRKILDDSLAMQFTWAGQTGKLEFKSLNICQQLKLEIKKIHKKSEKRINFYIGECLKQTRGKKKKIRNDNPRNQKNNKNNNNDNNDEQEDSDDDSSSGDEDEGEEKNYNSDADQDKNIGWSAFDSDEEDENEKEIEEDQSEKENEDDNENEKE